MENYIFNTNKIADLIAEVPDSDKHKIISTLKEKCLAKDAATSTTAVHALLKLVENGVLSLPQGLSTIVSLISSSSSKETIPSLVPAVGRIVLIDASNPKWSSPYNISNRPHPLLIILKNDWNSWISIYSFINNLMLEENSAINDDKKNEIIWPILSYVLMNSEAPYLAKSQTVRLLVTLKRERELIELLSWQQVDLNWCWLVHDILTRHLEVESSGSSDIFVTLTSSLAAAVVFLVKSGHDPSCWISLLARCLTCTHVSDDVILFIFAQAIPTCSTLYLPQICQICKLIISRRNCSAYSAAAVTASLLVWSIAPNSLTPQCPVICQEFLNILPNLNTTIQSNLLESPLFNLFYNCNSQLRWAVGIVQIITAWKTDGDQVIWLKRIEVRRDETLLDLHPLLLAVGLQTKSSVATKTVLKILKRKCVADKKYAFSTLCLVLHKLSHEFEPQLQLEYLKLVPQMGVDLENVPLVLATIESLKGGGTNVMLPLRLNLLVKLWQHQPRVFPYLHTTLQTSSSKIIDNWKLQLARATALLSICHANPHTHVQELVGLLSNVLNASSSAMEEAPAACLALDAITELCRLKLIDAKGTWSALKGKMRRERRPLVAASLCRLLAETSEDTGCSESIAVLWEFVTAGCAASDALVALGHFPLHQFTLANIPDNFKKGLRIPTELATDNNTSAAGEESLSYVPGELWIQILDRIDENLVNACEKMVENLLRKEVADLPRGIYSVPLGASEPSTYAHLTPTSILRALVTTLKKSLSESDTKLRLQSSMLKILSKDYLRSFPPLDWSFLRPLFAEESLKMCAIRLCALQGIKSPSAKQLLQEFLDLININDIEVASELLSELPSIAQCVIASAVGTIVTDGLQTLLVNNNLFNEGVNHVRKTVALAAVPEANRKAAAKGIIALLLTDILPDIEGLDVLWDCLAELPESFTDPLVNPQKWPEVTSLRLQRALRVARACALSPANSTCPLESYIHLIETVCLRPSEHSLVLNELLTVLRTTPLDKSYVWLRQLITRLLAAINSSMPFKGCVFLLHIIVLTAAAMTGLDILVDAELALPDNPVTLLSIFPACMYNLSQHKEWESSLSSIIEGLYRISKWEELPTDYRVTIVQSLVSMRSHPYCSKERWCRLFYNKYR